jgi:spermidine synthase
MGRLWSVVYQGDNHESCIGLGIEWKNLFFQDFLSNKQLQHMIPRILIDSAPIPGSDKELKLYKHAKDWSIDISGEGELMSSRVHGSEEALAELTCSRVAGRKQPRVLIGGLGMGFTLAAALEHLGDQAELIVAELVPKVVEWNLGELGAEAGNPLQDKRVKVKVGDVANIMKAENQTFDAILLDVDNGPNGLTHEDNNWLYSSSGLNSAYRALKPGGILSVWSAGPDVRFSKRLRQTGFKVEEILVHAHGKKGGKCLIWIAERGFSRK